MSLWALLLGLVGGSLVVILRDALPGYVMSRDYAERKEDRNLYPQECAFGLAYLALRAARSYFWRGASGGGGTGGSAINARVTTRQRFSALLTIALSVAVVISVYRLPQAWPSPMLASIACLGLLLIAMTSFEWRFVPDLVTIVVAVAGTASAVAAGGAMPEQAFLGATTGFSVALALRAIAGMIRWEPVGYAIPKLCLAIGIWLGPRDVVIAIAAAMALAFLYWLVQTSNRSREDETLPVGGLLAAIGVANMLLGVD